MAAGRYGLQVADIHSVVASAIGGENVGRNDRGPSASSDQRPLPARVPRFARTLARLPIVTDRGAQIRLSDVAKVEIRDGPPMLKSENGRLSGGCTLTCAVRDLRSAVTEMQQRVAREVKLPPGYSISWSGQFEYLERATQRLKIVVPATLAVIFLLLFLTFRSAGEALLIMGAVPFALAGGSGSSGFSGTMCRGERGRIHSASRLSRLNLVS
jgi:Cu(I)/Ag(I) efflux system membrane protein CusA/SilA